MRGCLEHMHVEEAQVLPLAEAVLGADDRAEFDRAFLAHRDPRTGFDAVATCRPLFDNLLRALPARCGVGSAIEALAGAALPTFGSP